MAEDDVTRLESRWRRLPAGGEPIGEEFIVCRIAIPHGDRQDSSQSGRGVHDESPVAPPNDDVVAILVLDDDPRELTGDCRVRTTRRPVRERLAKRAMCVQKGDKFRITHFRSCCDGSNVHVESAPSAGVPS